MKDAIKAFLLMLIVVYTSGCSTTNAVDRKRDAADIFTFTVGHGFGAKAQLGPVAVSPLLLQNDSSGLRGGAVFDDIKGPPDIVDGGILEVGFLGFAGEGFGIHYQNWDDETLSVMKQRGKVYMWDEDNYLPFLELPQQIDGTQYPSYTYSQVDVVVALGFSVRVGFNLGEFLDWALGYLNIDIFNDDLEQRKAIKAQQQIAEEPIDLKEE